MSKTMDQHRAAWAWAQTPGNPSKEYVSLTEGTPATILQCGLGQTVAFYLAKSEAQHLDLLRNLALWLRYGRHKPEEGEPTADPEDQPNDNAAKRKKKSAERLLRDIMKGTRDEYHALTDEVLDYLVWLKRFAKARSSGA